MRGFQDRVGFIWSVADEILRDDFKRSRYPDVILPFTVLRRVDCVLEPTKDKVLERYESLKGRLDNLHGPLAKTAGHFFYNVSEYTFARLLGGGAPAAPEAVSGTPRASGGKMKPLRGQPFLEERRRRVRAPRPEGMGL